MLKIKYIYIALSVLLLSASNVFASGDRHGVRQASYFHEFIPNDPNFSVSPIPVSGARAIISRRADEVKFLLHSKSLTPGAYSVWMRAFNRPDLCAGGENVYGSMCSRSVDIVPNPSPCIADEEGNSSCSVFWVASTIVGEDGLAHVSASIKKNDWPGMVLLGPDTHNTPKQALWNMLDSELHFILRYHGPAAAPEGPIFARDPSTGTPNPVSQDEKDAFVLLGRQLNRVLGNCAPALGEPLSNCADMHLAVFPSAYY